MSLSLLLRRIAALPPRAQLTAACAAALIAVAIGTAFVITRDTRVALFASPLKPDQLAEVETRLAAWNAPYAAGPDNVRVDRARRADLLLRLSLAGIPRPHLAASDELLGHLGALTPQAVLEAQTRDGLAADLALGLRGLDGVGDARVVIAPASGGVYADEATHDASAAVRIALAPGAHLSARTVAGIKAFVAGGVPGLAAERVTVLDDRGLVVAAEAAGGDVDGTLTALQSALDGAFGAGVTIVRVHREPLGETRDVHDVRRTPLAGAIARSSSDERYAAERKRYSKTNAVEERGSETHDERRLALPGATDRVSVAVFVDAARGLDLEKIRRLAAATAGIVAARGDTLSVEAVRFDAPVRTQPAPAPLWLIANAAAGMLPQTLLAVALAVGGAAAAKPAYALAVRALETASVRVRASDVAGIPPGRVRGALVGEPPHIAAAIISALPAATATAVLELYPPEERAAIVRRLSTSASALVPDPEELIRVRA